MLCVTIPSMETDLKEEEAAAAFSKEEEEEISLVFVGCIA